MEGTSRLTRTQVLRNPRLARATRISAMIGVAVAVGLLISGSFMLQDRMLYFPERVPLADMVGANLKAWPDEPGFRGLLSAPVANPGRPAATTGTAVVFHGNAGHAAHRAFYIQALAPLGLRVILAEYPGYGPRAGDASEDLLVRDAEETIELAHRLHGDPLIIIGESLGAAVAAAASARQQDKVSALLLITPWEKLEQVASFHYPWLPVKWLLRDRYDTAANLRGFTRPVVVAVAEADAIVPARFGQALYESLSQPKSLILFESAGHNDWASRTPTGWWGTALTPWIKRTPT